MHGYVVVFDYKIDSAIGFGYQQRKLTGKLTKSSKRNTKIEDKYGDDFT